MKKRHYLSSLFKALFGCTRSIDIEPAPHESEVERAWQRYCKEIRVGGAVNRPMDQPSNLLIDIIHAELIYGNYKSSQMLRIAIERFNMSSTALGKRMLILSIIMSILVLVQIFIMINLN